jgi:site-specific recombinase XerD
MPIRLEDLLGSSRRHLRAASKAPRTVELYSQSVRSFSQWLVARDRPATLDERSRHAMSAWLAELAETCEPSTVATRLSGMHRCCRWLVTEGEVDKAPTDGIEIATAPDKPVPVLTDAEITALLKTCAVGRGRPGVFSRPIFFRRRDEAILRLPLDTGIRVSEPCGLTLDDADLERELAYVVDKGSRPRVVPFGAKTGQAIDRYLRVRALHPYASSAQLLLGLRGPMTTDGAREVLNVRSAQAGLEGVHPHRFRHTFAHRWLAGGGQERDLMMLAGWRSDDMLSRYAASTAVQRARGAPPTRPRRPAVKAQLRRAELRAFAEARANRSMCAVISVSARRARSAGSRVPSGSASRSNFARRPRRAGSVAAPRSLVRAQRSAAAIRAITARSRHRRTCLPGGQPWASPDIAPSGLP